MLGVPDFDKTVKGKIFIFSGLSYKTFYGRNYVRPVIS